MRAAELQIFAYPNNHRMIFIQSLNLAHAIKLKFYVFF